MPHPTGSASDATQHGHHDKCILLRTVPMHEVMACKQVSRGKYRELLRQHVRDAEGHVLSG